jgi:hypothetical protein
MPKRTLFTLALLAALAACGEKPQNHFVSEAREQERDQLARSDEQRQRTIGQNEGDRIHNDGMLR